MDRRVKVGAFVFLGIAVLAVTVFLIGDNRRVWDRKVTFTATFGDVAGLRPGAPVRMGGIDVGTVGPVSHATENRQDTSVHVRIDVSRKEAQFVRADSIARVVNKGLLGDKMIEITTGTPTEPAVPDGGELKSEDPVDFGKYLVQFESIAKKTEKTVENLEKVTSALGDPKFTDDIKGTASDIHALFDGIVQKKGVAHQLVFDEQTGRHFDQLLVNLERTTGHLDAVSANLADVSTHVRTGPGLAHDVLYDDKMSQAATGTLDELHKTLEAVRTQNGIAHAVVYGDSDTQQIMGNLNAMSGDLRKIVADIKAGKGTIGGLLVDPSVYEDLKALVGNVERNQVLRALVRYSIKQDEKAGGPAVEVKAAPAPPK